MNDGLSSPGIDIASSAACAVDSAGPRQNQFKTAYDFQFLFACMTCLLKWASNSLKTMLDCRHLSKLPLHRWGSKADTSAKTSYIRLSRNDIGEQPQMWNSELSNIIPGRSNVRCLCGGVGFWPPRTVVRALTKNQCSNATSNEGRWLEHWEKFSAQTQPPMLDSELSNIISGNSNVRCLSKSQGRWLEHWKKISAQTQPQM